MCSTLIFARNLVTVWYWTHLALRVVEFGIRTSLRCPVPRIPTQFPFSRKAYGNWWKANRMIDDYPEKPKTVSSLKRRFDKVIYDFYEADPAGQLKPAWPRTRPVQSLPARPPHESCLPAHAPWTRDQQLDPRTH